MIIQCKQCRIKFRFDDALMEGDGIWMRCSRCQHVFFQDNPGINISAPVIPASSIVHGASPVKNGRTPLRDETPGVIQYVTASDVRVGDAPSMEFQPAKKAGMDLSEIKRSPAVEEPDEVSRFREATEEKSPPPVDKKIKLWIVALWTLLVFVVAPGIFLFIIFPQLGERYVKLGEQYLSVARQYVGLSQPTEGRSVKGYVKLQDIRQRLINNYNMGNIRVVEGTAVNQADFDIARILIKAEMLDTYAVVLDGQTSYAGNILTDEELVNLTKEEINNRLTQPQGRDSSNMKIIPNGRIPFMIVFAPDLPGTFKTTVTIAGAERLL